MLHCEGRPQPATNNTRSYVMQQEIMLVILEELNKL